MPKYEVSVHALSRLASRFNLLADRGVEARIERAMNDGSAILVTTKRAGKAHLYEMTLLGRRIMLVINPKNRVIMTVIDPERFYKTAGGVGRNPRVRGRRQKKGGYGMGYGEEE